LLAPLVMGTIAKQLGGKPSAQGLTQFFNEQKTNITKALPSGFSLASIPGLSDVGATVQQAADTVKKVANPLTWIVPVLLVALGLLLWYYLRPAEPVKLPGNTGLAKQITKSAEDSLKENINSFFTTATESFSGIKDAASADAALPKLKELAGQADDLKKSFALLPEAGKGAMKTLLGSSIDKLKAVVDKLMALPGVGEKLKPVVELMMAKLTAITG
jgi:hypothetical protein